MPVLYMLGIDISIYIFVSTTCLQLKMVTYTTFIVKKAIIKQASQWNMKIEIITKTENN